MDDEVSVSGFEIAIRDVKESEKIIRLKRSVILVLYLYDFIFILKKTILNSFFVHFRLIWLVL